jgi:DNA-binding response OmpR family regulator
VKTTPAAPVGLRYAQGVPGILVIEDDPVNQMILADYLAANGYEMHRAANGVDGLTMCARVDPVLVLVDVQLPGKNGFDVCREIKAARPTRPVLMMSAAYSRHDQFNRTGQLGVLADGYLAKPFDLQRLLAEVQRLIGDC